MRIDKKTTHAYLEGGEHFVPLMRLGSLRRGFALIAFNYSTIAGAILGQRQMPIGIPALLSRNYACYAYYFTFYYAYELIYISSATLMLRL